MLCDGLAHLGVEPGDGLPGQVFVAVEQREGAFLGGQLGRGEIGGALDRAEPILGRGNRLFLASTGSALDTPRDRSISAQEIRDFIDESRAERKIVVLDCCHSGAFVEGVKAAAPPPAVTPETFSEGDAGSVPAA